MCDILCKRKAYCKKVIVRIFPFDRDNERVKNFFFSRFLILIRSIQTEVFRVQSIFIHESFS